ncbi:MAG: MmgE/PrpD family protein [Rhodospirillaceae bacterium]|nr:MmgE/PrpD family protein [Rhodospirillaceae bacterium]
MSNTASQMNPIESYGKWLAEAPAAWPGEALHSAKRQLIDVMGVTILGAVDEATTRVFATVQEWGDGPCTVIGQSRTLSAPWAALVNGTAAHALDLDDNFDPAKAHATAVLAPAILALGEQEHVTGQACLDAYICGLQIMGRVGQGVNPTHRNRGWHATATVGALGAAAACARLLKLNAEQAGHAVSLATSMAAGFMSQFGTMAKPTHAGLAAKAGVIAASMARNGVTAGRETLDGPTGMNRLMVGPDYEELRDAINKPEHGQTLRFKTEQVGEPLLILEHGLKAKRFANCASAHRSMDALLLLKEEHGFSVDDVSKIIARLPTTHLNNLMHHDPQDPMQAKFSLQYGLAVALLTGTCTLEDFLPEAIMRSEIRSLYEFIEARPVDKSEGEFPTSVEVHLKTGTCVEKSLAMPLGSKAAAFTDEQYWRKFDDCVSGLLSEDEAVRVKKAMEDFAELPDLASLLSPLRRPLHPNGM